MNTRTDFFLISLLAAFLGFTITAQFGNLAAGVICAYLSLIIINCTGFLLYRIEQLKNSLEANSEKNEKPE